MTENTRQNGITSHSWVCEMTFYASYMDIGGSWVDKKVKNLHAYPVFQTVLEARVYALKREYVNIGRFSPEYQELLKKEYEQYLAEFPEHFV